jgi:hypothetical protein
MAKDGSGSRISGVVPRPESEAALDTVVGADLGTLATMDTLISSATSATTSSFAEPSSFAEVPEGSAAGA